MLTGSAKTLEASLPLRYYAPMRKTFTMRLAWIVAIAAAGCLHTCLLYTSQRLQELLRKYRADQVTPEEYHQQRAKILAEP